MLLGPFLNTLTLIIPTTKNDLSVCCIGFNFQSIFQQIYQSFLQW